MKVNSRKMKQDDISQIYDLFTKTYKNIDYLIFQKKYNILIDDENSYNIVAVGNNKVLGFIMSKVVETLTYNTNILLINQLLVEESLKGKGIEQLILQDTIRFAREKNCKAIELLSDIDNNIENKVYENNGFQKTYYKFKKNLK